MANVEREPHSTKKSRRSSHRPSAPPPMPQQNPEAPQEAGNTVSAPVTAATSTVLTSPLDHILIFGHGWFQRLVLLCTTLAFFTTVLQAAAINSLALPADHWCRPPAEYAHVPAEIWRNTSVPLEADGVTRHKCLRYEPPLPFEEEDGFEERSTIPCDAGWDFEVEAASIIREWNIVCERDWIMTVLIAAYMFGGVIALPFSGIAADRIGRRPVLCIWMFLLMFSGIGVAFAKTLIAFAALRALLSAAAASVVVTSTVVLFEVTDTQHRALFCSCAVAGGALLAFVYQAVVLGMVTDWKAVQIVSMVPTCGLVLGVYLMEESPCWLLAVLKMRRAEDVLSWAARVNNADPDAFKHRLSALRVELKRQQEQQQDPGSSDIFSGPQDVHVTELVRNQSLRHRSLVAFGCWLVGFAVYYKLLTGQVMRSNHWAQIALVLLRLAAIIMNVIVITYAGRRRTLSLSLIIMAVVTGALAIGHTVRAPGYVLAALIVVWMLLWDLCAVTLFILTAELYPTVVRGAGLAFSYTCGCVGCFIAPFLNEIQSADMKGLMYATAAALLLFFGVMALALPETTELQPANTMHDFAAEKWQLQSPLRVARRGSKRKRAKSGQSDIQRAAK
ncbi:solute carrier family 22 member 7-like [Amblyomma americanum]